MSYTSTHLLALPELLSAKHKLGEAASFNDVRKYNFTGLKADETLEPFEFRQQLQRVFDVILTDDELGSLVSLFDKKGDGKVNLVDFIHEFFVLGKIQRDSKKKSNNSARKRQNDKIKKKGDILLNTIVPKNTIKLPTTWSNEHEISAAKKILRAALSYTGRYQIEEFYATECLSPYDFKSRMQSSFGTNLSGEELASLVNRYSHPKIIESVDCVRFLYEFFRLRSDNQHRLAGYQFYMSHRRQEDERMFVEDMMDKMAYTAPVMMRPATQEEMQSAFVKLKNASSFVKPDIFGNLRKHFEASDLSPTMLQKFLISSFDVELNGGELDATMRVFDLNGDGAISYGEFMTTFYQLGLEERSRRLLAQKTRDKNIKNENDEKIQKRNNAFDEEIRSHIVWPILPDDGDLDEAIEPEEAEDDLEGDFSQTLPPLSPSKGQGSRGSTANSRKNFALLFPRITPETKDFLEQLEMEENLLKSSRTKLKKKKLKNRRIPSAYTETTEYDEEEYDYGNGGSSDMNSKANSPDEEGKVSLDGWGFDQQAALNSTTTADEGNDSFNLTRKLSENSNSRPDSRAFDRPDSRAVSRGSLREQSSFQGAPPPVNPSGLSGFRTAGATGEEEEEYGQDDFAVDSFDT